LDWFEAEYNVKMDLRFEEDGGNYEEVIKALTKAIKNLNKP
jgi:hypothetical protein